MRGFLAGAACGLVVVLGVVAMIGPPFAADAPETRPELTPEAMRAMIYADDVAGVDAALRGLSTEGHDAQTFIRNVYGTFGERHPKVIAFTKAWAKQAPTSIHAMTARGWALHAEGWAMRGTGLGRDLSPEAAAGLRAAHAEGLALMQAVLAIEPAYLPASDGVLAMSYTIGQGDLIEPEVARIMALRPNRRTLTLAGRGLAPNWGGSVQAMGGLCNRFAPLVTDRPGYDAEVCLIDGTMMAGYLEGDELQAMRELIAASENPLIAEWNGASDIVPGETPSDRLAHLDMVKRTRDLSYDEARVYDQDAAQLAILAGEPRPPEFPAALSRAVVIARSEADAKPGDWSAVARFLNIAAEDRAVNGTKADMDELWQRQIGALRLLPYDPKPWSSVAQSIYARNAATREIGGLAEAEPYFVNAVAYSNHQSQYLAQIVSPKLSMVVQAMMAGSLPVEKDRWQVEVQCPLVRQLRLLMEACTAEGVGFSECTGLPYEAQNMKDLIRDIKAAGICRKEASAPLETLAYSPVTVEMSAD